ncbi:MAG: hypothetical protein ACRDKE_02855 [Solirubrobacterales bacterium]
MTHSTFRTVATLLGIATLLLSIGTATASASSSAIYQACKTGGSMSGFSKDDLQGALGGVPADLDEYYGCSSAIQQAIIDKTVKKINGGKRSGVKGKEAISIAGVNDLTTPAERKKLAEQVEKSTQLDTSKPLTSDSDPAISEAAGQTLASSTAPGTPTALIIGVIGLLLLLAADLAGRLGKIPRVTKYLPWSGPRDSD